MCGIAGYVSFNDVVSAKFTVAISIMAIEMEPRGQQAWGWLSDTEYYKTVGKLTETFQLPEVMPKRFVLHTRFGTHGENKAENAHPFFFKDKHYIAGVHNGVISNHEELNAKYARNNVVDSQHIFQSLAEDKPLDDLIGYGAIVYHKDGNWFIGRFNGGEMSVAVTEEGVFFASTFDAVKLAMSMARIKVKYYATLKDSAIYELLPTGVKKSYKVKLEETHMRWDDKLYDPYDRFSYSGKGSSIVGKYTKTLRGEGHSCEECFRRLSADEVVSLYNQEFCEDCAIEHYGYISSDDYSVRKAEVGEECEFCRGDFMEGEPLWSVKGDTQKICEPCFDSRYTLADDDDDEDEDESARQEYAIELAEDERTLLLEAQAGDTRAAASILEAKEEAAAADEALREELLKSKVSVGAWDAC